MGGGGAEEEGLKRRGLGEAGGSEVGGDGEKMNSKSRRIVAKPDGSSIVVMLIYVIRGTFGDEL